MRPHLDAYTRWWVELTPGTVDDLDALASPEMRFTDPFHDLQDREQVKTMMRRILSAISDIEVTVHDAVTSDRAGYLRWRYAGKRGQSAFAFEGMSEITFDEAGRVTCHTDHWDSGSQLYARLPVIGPIIGLIRSRAAP